MLVYFYFGNNNSSSFKKQKQGDFTILLSQTHVISAYLKGNGLKNRHSQGRRESYHGIHNSKALINSLIEKRAKSLSLKVVQKCYRQDIYFSEIIKKALYSIIQLKTVFVKLLIQKWKGLQTQIIQFFFDISVQNQRNEVQAQQRDSQIDLISQYLELNPHASRYQSQIKPKKYQSGENSSSQKKPDRSQDGTDCASSNQKKKTSLFHNFQKHLIKTLKSIIKLRPTTHNKNSSLLIAHDIWEFFCQSNKQTKRFLLCLLGKGNQNKNPLKGKESSCMDCHQFFQYLKEYSEKDIETAQNFLVKEIIRQSLRALQFDELKIRRIKKYEDFKLYYQKFIEELEKGSVSKRLPKVIKMELVKSEQPIQTSNSSLPINL